MINRPVRVRIKKLVLPDGSHNDGDKVKATLQRALESQFRDQSDSSSVDEIKAQITRTIQRELKQ